MRYLADSGPTADSRARTQLFDVVIEGGAALPSGNGLLASDLLSFAQQVAKAGVSA